MENLEDFVKEYREKVQRSGGIERRGYESYGFSFTGLSPLTTVTCPAGGWNIDHKQKYQEPILCLPFSLWKIVEHFSLVSPYELLNQVCYQTQAWKITCQAKGIKEEIDNSLLIEDAKNFDF